MRWHKFRRLVENPRRRLAPGLPDGIFAFQKSQIWFILEGIEM
jgi:hypothetical protein